MQRLADRVSAVFVPIVIVLSLVTLGAWLAIGATPREAVRDIARAAAAEALVPGLDQTRTVGLVTLPGAFVGALLGGASPVAAARFQLVVLVGLLCAQVITATVVVNVQGAPTRLPMP